MRSGRDRRFLAVLAVVLVAAVAACGSGGASTDGALAGARFTVGSKEFTEQLVLGEIAVQALRAVGADVGPLTTITGTSNVRTALTSGQIDLYWEYTGTGWGAHLEREVSQAPRDPAQLFAEVANADAPNGVSWLDPAPLNNAYAIALPRARQEQLGVRTLSDYAALVQRDPAQARLCAAAEFLTRDDGFPGLQRTYGFQLPTSSIAELELSLIPKLTAEGKTCAFGEVFVTDGAVAANDLVLLVDDRKAIVDFNAAITIRTPVLDAHPQLRAVFGPISAALTSDEVRTLNERVDVGGELPDAVAGDWLRAKGFVT